MREGAIELGREQKSGIYRRDFAAPELRQFRLQRPIERGVDFRGVEEACQVFERVCFAALHSRGIKDAIPVFVRPPRRTDADLMRANFGRPDWGRGFHARNRRGRAGASVAQKITGEDSKESAVLIESVRSSAESAYCGVSREDNA